MKHTFVHVRMSNLMSSFNYDAHPMGMFIRYQYCHYCIHMVCSSMAAMSTFHADANPALKGADLYLGEQGEQVMNKQILRILGKAPTVAAAAYRHRIGRPTNLPRNDLDYCENLLYMMDSLGEGPNYTPHPVLVKALDVMFTLHAEHEMNCSTAAMLHIGSSRVDPYSAIAGAAAALYGPLHGGANEAVLRMLEEIGSVERVGEFVELVKGRKRRLMGFGHRVYKKYDPRAKLIQRLAHSVFEVTGREPLIQVAIALEQRALNDDYFISRRLYPNVDFYSGLIYKAMGFPTDYFPLLFALPRIAGWLAHWREQLLGRDQKIWRPLQVYCGDREKEYVEMRDRTDTDYNLKIPKGHPFNRRYLLSIVDSKL